MLGICHFEFVITYIRMVSQLHNYLNGYSISIDNHAVYFSHYQSYARLGGMAEPGHMSAYFLILYGKSTVTGIERTPTKDTI